MSAPTQPRILGICGSLRQRSFNAGLLRAVAGSLPSSVQYELAEIADLPLFNEDKEKAFIASDPHVIKFRAQLLAADAVLIATPAFVTCACAA